MLYEQTSAPCLRADGAFAISPRRSRRFKRCAKADISEDGQSSRGARFVRTIGTLRDALGLSAEQFALQAFVSMIRNEVEQLCYVGRSDTKIADLIRTTSGKIVILTDHAAFYAPPKARHGG